MKYATKRSNPRYRLSIPVELVDGAGVTRNISVGGIYFETDKPLAVGERMTFRIVLNASSLHPITLPCEATVLRVEPAEHRHGVAARIDRYDSMILPEQDDANFRSAPSPARIERARRGR